MAKTSLSERWRGLVRTGEAAVVLGLWAAGLAAGDMVITAILLVAGLLVSLVAVAADSTRSRVAKAFLSVILILFFATAGTVAYWRHTSDTAAQEAARSARVTTAPRPPKIAPSPPQVSAPASAPKPPVTPLYPNVFVVGVGTAAFVVVGLALIRWLEDRIRQALLVIVGGSIGRGLDPNMPSTGGTRPRSSTEMQFLAARWWFSLWAGPPLYIYQAKRRLEFIDSWTVYFRERDDSTTRSFSGAADLRQVAIINALDYTVDETPDGIYYLCYTREQLERNIQAAMTKAWPPGAAAPVQSAS